VLLSGCGKNNPRVPDSANNSVGIGATMNPNTNDMTKPTTGRILLTLNASPFRTHQTPTTSQMRQVKNVTLAIVELC